MKVLLIKPQITIPKFFKGVAHLYIPIGLGYLASVCKKEGFEVKVIDATLENYNKINKRNERAKYVGLSFEELNDMLINEKPDVVGITSLSVDVQNAYTIIQNIKNTKQNIITVMGGPHVSAVPDDAISRSYVDFVIVGEGEYAFVNLLKELKKENPNYSHIKGLVYKKDSKIYKNPPELITDLDKIPFPDRDAINVERYYKAYEGLQGSRSLSERQDTIISSRGCPFKCTFCSIGFTAGKIWRGRSPENVVEEIEYIVNKYNVKHVNFEDDNLTFSRERMNSICDLLIKKGLNKKITWSTPNGVRADRLDEELLKKMKESGCNCIIVAPESGSQYVVSNIIHKNLDLKVVEDVVKICKKIDLHCDAFFVIGFPNETKEQIEETIRFIDKLKKLGGHPLPPFIAQPYYGTELYRIAKEKGYMKMKDGEELELSFINEGSAFETPEFSSDYLLSIRRRYQRMQDRELIVEFLSKKPQKIVKLIVSKPRVVLDYVVKFLFLRRNM